MEVEGALQLKIEKIIRSRAYETRYWKEECFGLTAETIVDKAVELDHVGGQFGNQTPTHFLCLIIKLLQIEPPKEIVLEFVQDPEFKYLRALGAFYLRLTFTSLDIYTHLEPLLADYRKLRSRVSNAGNEFTLTYMDQFIDDLLIEDRVCDVILPRLPSRETLEDHGDLDGPRISSIQEEFLDSLTLQHNLSSDSSDRSQFDHDLPEPANSEIDIDLFEFTEVKVSKKKLAKLFKSSKTNKNVDPAPSIGDIDDHSGSDDHDSVGGRFKDSMSIEETNALRIKMGLKPLAP